MQQRLEQQGLRLRLQQQCSSRDMSRDSSDNSSCNSTDMSMCSNCNSRCGSSGLLQSFICWHVVAIANVCDVRSHGGILEEDDAEAGGAA